MSAPLKQVRIKQRTERWMNNEIIAIIREKCSLQKYEKGYW